MGLTGGLVLSQGCGQEPTPHGDFTVKLTEQLDKYGVSYNVTKGKVTLESVPPDDSGLLDAEGVVVDAAFDVFLDELDGLTAYLDEHPYGREGGYVVWVERGNEKSWFDEHGENEWING